jgi:hypothetical protein
MQVDYPLVAPIMNMSINPLNVAYGGSIRLSWTNSNADTCIVSGNWSGNKSTSDTRNENSLTLDKTYTLTCSGAGGSVSNFFRVTVACYIQQSLDTLFSLLNPMSDETDRV